MKKVNVNEYKVTDCGRYGKAMERTCTGKAKAKAAGKVDWYHLKERYEVKTGAGELANYGEKLLKNSKKVLYIPVVYEEEDGSVLPEYQEGFILDRETFLAVLDSVGLIREKVSTAGVRKITIQTFWNRSKNAPHGSKYEKLIDALYDNCLETLEDMLERERG